MDNLRRMGGLTTVSVDMRARKWLTCSPQRCISPVVSTFSEQRVAHIRFPKMRFRTWRKLWLNLAIAEKELGLPISDEAIEQMGKHLVSSLTLLFRFGRQLHPLDM